jgi:hypothetical protein
VLWLASAAYATANSALDAACLAAGAAALGVSGFLAVAAAAHLHGGHGGVVAAGWVVAGVQGLGHRERLGAIESL